MTETDEKHENPEEKKPTKQGLHGWKAALAMFGCGSLAAFGIFGAISAMVGSFLGIVSDGVDQESSDGGAAEGIGESRSSLSEGEMNVCDDNLDPYTQINIDRQDAGENYLDVSSEGEIAISGADRVVQDECTWLLRPSSGSSPWNFVFSYEAVIDAGGGSTSEELAALRFDELAGQLEGELEDVSSQGAPGFDDSAVYVYGDNDVQGQSYIALVQASSAVYSIHFEATGDAVDGEVSKNEFEGEARGIASFLDNGFDYWIPAD